jgi:hypothetical protein
VVLSTPTTEEIERALVREPNSNWEQWMEIIKTMKKQQSRVYSSSRVYSKGQLIVNNPRKRRNIIMSSFKKQYGAQDAWIRKVMAVPMPCPICHLPIDFVAVQGDEHMDNGGAAEGWWDLACPKCQTQLHYEVHLWGPPCYTILPGQTINYDPDPH